MTEDLTIEMNSIRLIHENILLKKYNFMSTSDNHQNVSLISNMPTTSSLNLTNEAKLTKDDLIKYFKSILNYNLVTLVLDLDSNVQNKKLKLLNRHLQIMDCLNICIESSQYNRISQQLVFRYQMKVIRKIN